MSTCKVFTIFVPGRITNAIFRRGYAARSQGVVEEVSKSSDAAISDATMLKKTIGERAAKSTEKVAWTPDPKTGYYRPDTGANEVDPTLRVVTTHSTVALTKLAWTPDPKTGYYRPDSGADEVDPAELRALLLKKR